MDPGHFLTDSGSKIPQLRPREIVPKPLLAPSQIKKTDYVDPTKASLAKTRQITGKSAPNLSKPPPVAARGKAIARPAARPIAQTPSSTLKRHASADELGVSSAKIPKTTGARNAFPYKAKNWELKARLAECEEWFTDAQAQIQELEETAKRTSEQLEEHQLVVTQLKNEKERSHDLQNKLNEKSTSYDRLHSESKEFLDKIALLQLQLDTKNDMISQLEKVKANLQEEAITKSAKISELQLKLDELQLKHRQQTLNLETVESAYANAKEQILALEQTNRTLRGENLSYSTELTSVKDSLSDECKTVGGLRSQCEEMRLKLCESDKHRRFLHNLVQDLKGNIRVFCRVRPPLSSEKENSVMCSIGYPDDGSIEISKADPFENANIVGASRPKFQKHEFTFDKVFNPSANQSTVFEEISQLVQSALDGYNVCVFAYGQTGSGKTYTMEGQKAPDARGMIPRTVQHIFETASELKKIGWDYTVEVCFIEIYNEIIRDLLRNDKEGSNLKIMQVDGRTNDVVIPGLTIMQVDSCEDLDRLYVLAHKNRAVATTSFNEHSSRSHSITKIKVTGVHKDRGETCYGSLNLVDLAGSERLSEQVSANDSRFREMKNINKSLSELGNVIQSLFQKNDHVPYRNSKLTHLLQPALGGSSKTLMMVNISPVENCLSETLCSLRFAQKVNQVKVGVTKKRIMFDPASNK